MKLLFDQNLSPWLAQFLSDIFPDSVHVRTIGLDCALDRDILDYAKANDFIIVTKDVDFSEMNIFIDPPAKIIWIRKGNCTTDEIEKILRNHSEDITRLNRNEIPPVLILA